MLIDPEILFPPWEIVMVVLMVVMVMMVMMTMMVMMVMVVMMMVMMVMIVMVIMLKYRDSASTPMPSRLSLDASPSKLPSEES